MGCGASSVNLENDEKKKDKRSRKSSSSSSSSSDNSSDEESPNGEPIDMITKTLLKEYLDREINMLKLELTQPEVVLKQLLEQKDLTSKQLISNSKALEDQRTVCMREYQDITNLQSLIQQRQAVSKDTWDTEQKEYVEAYNKHKQLEEAHSSLEKQSRELDVKIKNTSKEVRQLLKLRKKQDHILNKTFDGGYGSEKEASIEEYVDKMKEFRKNILNTKTQWKRGLDFTKGANLQYWRGVQVWTNILSHRQPATRWQYCAYVTNYLNAAQTNSQQAVNCMSAHAQIPYYTEKMFREVAISRRNAYTACQPNFHATFLQWLWYYQQNSAYLEKWIEKTLAQTIEGDLIKVNGYLIVAEADLRAERKRLIIERVKEKFGEGVESEVAAQEAEVDRLSKEVNKMQSVSIQANIMTVSASSGDSGVESEGEGPPPAAGTRSTEDVTQQEDVGVSEEVTEADDEEARMLAQKREEESAVAKAAEEDSRRRLDDAKAKIASLENATVLLEKEKAEAEAAQKEALEKKKLEEEAAAARVAAEEAAANAAAEQKDQLLKEAKLAAEAAEKAKAEAMKWTQMAEEAAKKAEVELEGSKKAAEERAAAEKEAHDAEENARKAKEELDRITAEAAARKETQVLSKEADIVERPEKAAEQKPEEVKTEENTEPAPNLQSDIDTIMNDYKSSVEQFNRKRGTEETRMDLDLQEKLKARRHRRRQQIKQKLQEQKLLGDEEDNTTK